MLSLPWRPGSRTLLLLLLGGIMLAVGAMEPRFFTGTNLLNVLRQSSIIGIISLGMTVVILTGGIDLSVGSILALSVLFAASAAKAGVAAPLAWCCALAGGAGLGWCNGFGIARLRLPPFIVTLGMMGCARGLALLYTGGAPLTGFSALFRFPGTGRFGGIPVPVLLFALAFLAVFVLLERCPWGERVRSVGSNSAAAWGSGIDVPGTVAKAYVLSGTLAALAGLVLMGRLDSAQPSAGLGYEFGAIAGVVLGGTSFSGGQGTLAGTIVGVLIMGVLENGMNLLNVNPFSEQVVKGVVIAVALVAYGSLGRRSRVAG
ncbi:ABC transporter permease [Aminiphilus circumscriptus]|jgi:ribose/xylose/arabinose/galactoside ABC-type transport system permease subunit|uniref:ABC transporter permease n=1 Tax=Aminiphilus circumscriptus TaxID=290732 RepID=UPI00047859AA|nr:ABC transporter permease [Aminiphilus circumscriptus]